MERQLQRAEDFAAVLDHNQHAVGVAIDGVERQSGHTSADRSPHLSGRVGASRWLVQWLAVLAYGQVSWLLT